MKQKRESVVDVEKVICPSCGGRGQTPRPNGMSYQKCSACRGSGQVVVVARKEAAK